MTVYEFEIEKLIEFLEKRPDLMERIRKLLGTH
jgi:hypothetical protein